VRPSPESFLGRRLAEASPADAAKLLFALEADLASLQRRLASARDAGDQEAIALTARSLAHLLEEAGLDELLTLARPLATVVEHIRPARRSWAEDVGWLLQMALRTATAGDGNCNTPV
jgi:hypothetical protein